MDVISLKQYIFEKEKIEFVLNKIGCKNIEYHANKDYYSCSNWDGDNINAVNVKNNSYLNVRNWTRKGFDEKADIITLVEYNRKISFIQAVKYLHSILGLSFKWKSSIIKETTPKKDILNMGAEILLKHANKRKIDVADIHTLDENILHDYIPLLYIGWLREGIFFTTAKKFGIAYSYKRRRIIIPHRYWMNGELVGINARTTVDNYKEFDIKKYWITPTYQKSLNIYGLWEHYQSIQDAGYVVIYEAEKSVLKRDSLLDETGVAISGKNLSDVQVRILIGLNVDIVFALDKDVPIEETRFLCEKFYRIRNVSYLYDKWDLLSEKDSPADARNKIYQFLFEHRIVYNEEEHRAYLQNLKKGR